MNEQEYQIAFRGRWSLLDPSYTRIAKYRTLLVLNFFHSILLCAIKEMDVDKYLQKAEWFIRSLDNIKITMHLFRRRLISFPAIVHPAMQY